ncbi:MAG: hypothetical protein HY044_01880 [Candidatus Woesebacteria bacterium]|nr:MAG: hypothetical protein HY044_01880 [Candidatus Woesebacteria bacterium]
MSILKISESTAQGLSVCVSIFNMHGVENPLPWLRELVNLTLELNESYEVVTWGFWIGHNPSNSYEITVEMVRVLSESTNHFIWRPVKAIGFVGANTISESERRQRWSFISGLLEPGVDRIPFLRK